MSEPVIDAEPAPAAPGRSVGLLVVGAVLGVAAALALFVVLAGSWGLTEMYGSETVPLVGALPWVALPAVLLTASWAVTRAAVHRSARRWWVVLLALWVGLTLVVAAVVWLADQQHDADATARATACSEADVAILTSVPGYSPDLGEPTGQDDGSCSITLGALDDADAAVATVVAAMVADGWTAAPPAADGSVRVSRSGVDVVVRASATDDKGWTDVQVVAPAG